MSDSTLNPTTASRTVEGLMKETPFKLRLLAQALGGVQSEQDKMAWHDMKTGTQRAEYVLQLLQAWDKANPGAAAPMNGAANGAAHAPAPPMQQIAPIPAAAPTVAAVAPTSLAAAAAAASDKPKRSPRTSAGDTAPTGAAPADLGGDVLALLTRLTSAVEAQTASNAKVHALLDEAVSSRTSRVTALEGKYGEVDEKLEHLVGQLDGMQQIQTWTLMAFLTFMQESMGASMQDILGAAIGDSAMLVSMVEKIRGGKG